jgi:hypothetical protein
MRQITPRDLIRSYLPAVGLLYGNSEDLDHNNPPIPIIHGGLFHEDKHDHLPPYNKNFGNKIGGIYSHIFQDVCDKWFAQLKLLLPSPRSLSLMTRRETIVLTITEMTFTGRRA